MDEIRILGKNFRELVSESEIRASVENMASRMNRDLAGRDLIFVGILNGAFIFAADLFRLIDLQAKISFIKLASYEGTSTSGTIKELIGINEDITGKTVVVIEDIIDTGTTIERTVEELVKRKAGEIIIAALFFKPEAYLSKISIDYVGLELPDRYVIGYGLDYNGYGRNLSSVYALVP